ncbi:hypothetical protein EJP67_10785 [Variovorax guangxiensis]|uniref:Uncharacterized protein n=1 Tax=Variovorax guangxiensis TaxID=1775474 RepID=A0A433MJ64_9BURK|nr:protein DpdD [Variovorax guangxiensis]RUR67540.1 hypothetical protein EJP67_10785 [Variovorax guangxiensis]
MNAQNLLQQAPWLAGFFGPGNGLTWTEISSGRSAWTPWLRPWLALVEAGQADRGLVLPAVDDDGLLTWYGFASTPQDASALAEQVSSFLGPGMVDFDQTQSLVPSAPHEQVLIDQFRGHVKMIRLRIDANEVAAKASLSMLAELLLRRPARSRLSARPFGEVRTAFEQAIATGDEARARHCIDELRGTGRLSATNERFLDVRLRTACGQAAALVHDVSTMSMLADAYLPTRVLRDVVEALYAVHLARLPTDAAPEQWIEAYRGNLHRHDRLLRARRGMRSPLVLRTFLLRECDKTPAEMDRAEAKALHDALLAAPGHDEWATRIWNWALGRMPVDAGGQASASATTPFPVPAVSLNTAEGQLAHWLVAPPSLQALAALLRCALEIGTIDAAAHVISALRTFPSNIVECMAPVHQRMRTMLEDLVPQTEAAPTDWTGWAQRCVFSAPADAAGIAALAEQGAEEWDHAAWLADPSRVETFVDMLQGHGNALRPHLFTIYGSLCDLQDQPSALSKLVLQLLTLVALDHPEVSQLPTLSEWVSVLVRLGASRATLDEAAEAVHAAWDEVKSMTALDWACDVIETLASAPRRSNGPLDAFYSEVIGFASGHRHRLSGVQDRILTLLSGDFGLEWVPLVRPMNDATESAAAPRSFEGESIGIYTLQESIVARLRSAISAMLPGAALAFNHDHVATPALEHMAHHSTVVVFAWRRAKHQAAYCVQAQRPVGAPLLMPAGTGSASILRELCGYYGISMDEQILS